MNMRMRGFAVLFSVLLAGAVTPVRGAEGFSLVDGGVSTPRGIVPWNRLVGLRAYERAPQKLRVLTNLTARVRNRTPQRADVDLTEPQSRTYIPVNVLLDGRYLRVRVESGEIAEPLGACWRAMQLEILPGLLSSAPGSDGGYLLPLVSGAVVPASQPKALRSVDRFYMQQSEWEKFGLFNAFGRFGGSGSILGVVHGGEFRAWCETSFDPKAGARQVAVIGLRDDSGDALEHETKEVLYEYLPSVRDYTGMALAYRDYLLDERGLLPIVEREKLRPELSKVMSSMRFNVFLGMKTAPFRPDGSSPYHNSTTFAEAGRILDEARAAGLTNCWVTLVGWIKDGHDGSYPSHFPVNASAGTEDELRALIAKCRAWGWPVTPHDNVHSLYSASDDFDASVVSRQRNGELQSIGLWSGGLCNLACPQVWMARFGGEFQRIRDLGFDGVYYIDALASGLMRCHDPAHPATEREFALGQAKTLGYARSVFGASATENPAAYVLKYIDYGAAGGCGDRVWQSALLEGDTRELMKGGGGRFVPFYLAATHGIIATQCSWIHGYAGEGGVLPLFVEGGVPAVEVCMRPGAIGDYYADSIRRVKPAYEIYYELAPELAKGLVAEFDEYAPDCVRYRYDNGLEVKVNATGNAAGGLPPRSLVITRDGKEIYRK